MPFGRRGAVKGTTLNPRDNCKTLAILRPQHPTPAPRWGGGATRGPMPPLLPYSPWPYIMGSALQGMCTNGSRVTLLSLSGADTRHDASSFVHTCSLSTRVHKFMSSFKRHLSCSESTTFVLEAITYWSTRLPTTAPLVVTLDEASVTHDGM